MFTLRVLCIAVICVLTAGMAAPALATDCITGTVTAVETSPGSGLWKYCVSFTYDVTALANSPSHFSLLVGALADCPCVCETGVITFDSPAGTSTGSGDLGPCTVEYNGIFACGGDPTLPGDTGPSLKWEIPANPTCEPTLVGNGELCFYSVLAPVAIPSSTGIAIKLGQQSCYGTATGFLPSCVGCPVSTQESTWGLIKSLYRF
jgi:hypothetical protein